MPPPPSEWKPPGLLTASEVAAMAGVHIYTLKAWEKSGRLKPAIRVAPPEGGAAHRFYREADVSRHLEVADCRAPVQRVSAVGDAVRGGVPLPEALDICGVSRTTWNYWVRTRRDAAKVHTEAPPVNRAPSPESRMRGPSVIGQVYFVTGTEARAAIKIGWTVCDPTTRLRALQTGSPVELHYLALVRAHSPFEFWCHRQFEEDRKYGEWFARTPRLARFVSRMAEIGDVTTFTPGELLALLNVEPLSLFGGAHGPTP